MGIETAAIITLAVASAYQGYESYQQTAATKKEAKRQESQATKAAVMAKEEAAQEEANRQQAAMKKKKYNPFEGTPQRETILTSPLGVAGGGGGGKTLLGM